PAVVRLLQHCLEKRPEERFQSARDVAFDLRSLASGGSVSARSGVAAEPAMRETPAARWRIVAGALLLLAAGALGGYLASSRTASSATVGGGGLRPTFRQLTKLPGGEGTPTVAPDGESFVYASRDGDDLDLFVQRIDGSKAI